jgi:ribosomal protein S18 acetylase RimI-like enzyme
MEGLMIRKASAADTERIAEIMYRSPSDELSALLGCERAAREVGKAAVRMAGSPQGWQRSVVGVLDREVVGVVQGGRPDPAPRGAALRFGLRVLRIMGVSLLTSLPRLRARGRVQFDWLADSHEVAELHVDPRYRNRGIGGRLLHCAEDEAKRLGYRRMSLVTTMINPARRLYERHGFRVAETKTDAAYERATGIAGGIRMIKELP